MPSISVIMPVYNVEKYLHKSVTSVLNQSFEDFELILVDDGSYDESPTICDYYAARDNRVRVIHKENGGLSSARNVGIEHASGIYALFLDSDDDFECDTLEKCWATMKDNNYDMLIFGYIVIVESNYGKQKSRPVSHKNAVYSSQIEIQKHFFELSHNGLFNFAWGKCYRIELIRKNNVISESFFDKTNEDTVFLLKLFPYLNSIAVIDSILQNYHIREGQSVTKSFVPQRYIQFYSKFLILKNLIDTFDEKTDNDDYIYSEYCKIILWAYESLFHKECDFSIWKRRAFIKKTFSIAKENLLFRIRAARYFYNSSEFNNVSRLSKKAVTLILFRLYFITWICHSISLLKL